MNIAERKRAIRRTVTAAIAGLSSEVRRASDAAICDAVRALPGYMKAEQLLAYWPLADEVDVRAALFTAVEAGKAVFLPVTHERSIVFRRWQPQVRMATSALGVQEPVSGEGPANVASAVLVPGRAFGTARHRLGRGGGFYDRVWRDLERFRPRIGVGYCCQVLAEVPHDEHDSVVDVLVCERGVVSDSTE